jgi:serine O-acetyltransferase
MMNTSVESLEKNKVNAMDPIWDTIRKEADEAAQADPVLATFLYSTILQQPSLEEAVIHRVCERLDHPDLPASVIRQTYMEMLADDPSWGATLRVDIQAVYDRDPACSRFIQAILYFKGFHAIQTHRLAHWLWNKGRVDYALYLQSRSSAIFQTDIDPASKLGKGLFLDHATGIVIGRTAVVGDNVSILQNVTLGGTGKEGGDRHPKIGCGVLIGSGAKVLGNIGIGNCSRIAAGSVVLKPVPANKTVAGVPARIVGEAGCQEPSRAMDQMINSSSQDASSEDGGS